MTGFGIVESDLSQSVDRNGAEIQVRVYRQEHDWEWAFEVVEGGGLSTFSDATYPSEQDALQTALRILRITRSRPAHRAWT